MRTVETSVLVVGGSTVGLLTGLLLSRQRVPVLVCERHTGSLRHPRAMGVGPRTVEILRQAGIADAVDQRCVDMSGSNLQMISARTLAELDLPALNAATAPPADALRGLTPQLLRGTCPQGRIDVIAAEQARRLGADIRFGAEVVELDEHPHGISALVRDADGPLRVNARYAVGADGARSTTRQQLGIATEGPGPIGDPLVSVLFHADLDRWTHGLPFVVCDITDPGAAGGLLPVDGHREWLYVVRCTPERGLRPDDFDDALCRRLIARAVGSPDLPAEILGTMTWQVTAQVAERFRSGRTFLAGDAAHVIPPVGAFGMNTGIADAHNLAWKLAFVLRGQAGPALLDSYQAERRPVARIALEQSMLRLSDPSLHWATGEEGRRKRAEAGALNAPVVHLGYRYASTAVLDAQPALPSTEDLVLDLDGAPGSRLPHDWLESCRPRSTLDLVKDRFTLLTTDAGADWAGAFRAAADDLGVELDSHRCPAYLAAVRTTPAALVRPDQMIAWRSGGQPPTRRAAREVLVRLLSRDTDVRAAEPAADGRQSVVHA